jgi:hypothetical protein
VIETLDIVYCPKLKKNILAAKSASIFRWKAGREKSVQVAHWKGLVSVPGIETGVVGS